jgi:hypothetical protein
MGFKFEGGRCSPARRHGHRQGGAVKLRQTFAEAKKIDDVSSRLAQSTIALVVA